MITFSHLLGQKIHVAFHQLLGTRSETSDASPQRWVTEIQEWRGQKIQCQLELIPFTASSD